VHDGLQEHQDTSSILIGADDLISFGGLLEPVLNSATFFERSTVLSCALGGHSDAAGLAGFDGEDRVVYAGKGEVGSAAQVINVAHGSSLVEKSIVVYSFTKHRGSPTPAEGLLAFNRSNTSVLACTVFFHMLLLKNT
jgi:hypothetical protein